MSTSWDKDGTSAKVCDGNNGALGFKPNVFCGLTGPPGFDSTVGNVFPSITIGVNDFCFEWWQKRTLYNTFNAVLEIDFSIGMITTNLAFITIDDDGNTLFFNLSGQIDDTMTKVAVGWHHYVVAFDRDGLATLKIDGQATDISVSIAAQAGDMGAMQFYPLASHDLSPDTIDADLISATDPGGLYPDSLTDPYGQVNFAHFPCVIGPIALHVGHLLSATEIADSIKNRTVQDLATTKVRWIWNNLQGVEGWDREPRHIIRGISDFCPVAFAAPIAEGGTIMVPDVSGEGNNLTLAVAGRYGQKSWVDASWPPLNWTTPIEGLRSRTAFGADPFFEMGGGVRDADGL